MKKIFIILTLLVNLSLVYKMTNNQVYASIDEEEVSKPLIVKQGMDYQEYLEYEGYDIVSSNVNFKKCGTYKVIYQHQEFKNEIEKIVYVKSKEELLTQDTYSENYKNLITLKDNIDVTKIKKYNNSYYISYRERLEEDKVNIGFMKITNNTINFDRIIFNNSSGLIKDFIINDEEIVLMVDKANTYSYLDLYYITLTHDGKSKYSYKYVGSNVEESSTLLESSKYYYLVLDTYSPDDGDYLFQHKDKSGVVFVVEKGTNKKSGLFDITEEGEVDVIDAVNVEEQIYVLYKTYNSKLSLVELKVAYIDTLKGTIKTEVISNSYFEYPQFIKKDNHNNIYVGTRGYSSSVEDYISKLYMLEENLIPEVIMEYQYPKEGNCIIQDIIIEDSDYAILYSIVTNDPDNRYGYLYQIVKKNSLKVEFEDFSATSMVNGFINSNELVFFDGSEVYIDYVNYSIFTDLKETQVIDNSRNFNLECPEFFANGHNCLIDIEKSKIEYDDRKYGKYKLIYYYTCDNVDVITDGIVEVLPYTNVYEGGVFDVNTIILTNGEATLNSLIISSGYKIEQCGTYKLVIKNNVGDIYEVNFEVANLTNNEIKLKEDKIKYSENDEYINNTNSIQIMNHLSEESFIKETTKPLWLVLLPLTALIGLGIVLFNRR